MAGQPGPPANMYPPQIHKDLIAGLIKGNQRVFISPDPEALFLWEVRKVHLTQKNDKNEDLKSQTQCLGCFKVLFMKFID